MPVPAESRDPSQLAFWKSRLIDGSILHAIKSYPGPAKEIFGVAPVLRGNLFQLGMILGAREILAAPPGELASQVNTLADPELRLLLDKLSDEAQSVAHELLSPQKQEKTARKLARRIIRDATGIDPQ
jgi:hypothetical protein